MSTRLAETEDWVRGTGVVRGAAFRGVRARQSDGVVLGLEPIPWPLPKGKGNAFSRLLRISKAKVRNCPFFFMKAC